MRCKVRCPVTDPVRNHDGDKDVFYGTMSQLTALLVHHVAGDYSHNNVVDAADYVMWRKTKGSTLNLTADGSLNNGIDTADYTYWRSRFGQSVSGAGSGLDSAGAVPEPWIISLLLSGGFFLALARARRIR